MSITDWLKFRKVKQYQTAKSSQKKDKSIHTYTFSRNFFLLLVADNYSTIQYCMQEITARKFCEILFVIRSLVKCLNHV